MSMCDRRIVGETTESWALNPLGRIVVLGKLALASGAL